MKDWFNRNIIINMNITNSQQDYNGETFCDHFGVFCSTVAWTVVCSGCRLA